MIALLLVRAAQCFGAKFDQHWDLYDFIARIPWWEFSKIDPQTWQSFPFYVMATIAARAH